MTSLANRRVVVTRASDQADGLAALLELRGARPVLMPLVEIVDEPGAHELLVAASSAWFDWIVFTSPNGARRGVRAGVTRPRGHRVPRIAAVGASTAHELGHADLVASRQSAAGLLAEFASVTGDNGATVLVVQAVDAQPTLVTGLVAKGYTVVAVPAYRSVTVVPSAAQQLAALAADAVLFASGSAARGWVQVFGDSSPPVVVAIGPETAAAATRAGLKVTVVAADHSLDGMVAALETWLQHE